MPERLREWLLLPVRARPLSPRMLAAADAAAATLALVKFGVATPAHGR